MRKGFLVFSFSWKIVGVQYYVSCRCMMIWRVHTLWNDHCDESSSHLSPYKVVTVSLPVFLMLYLVPHDDLLSSSGGLYHVIPFPLQMGHTTHLPPPISSLLASTVWSLYLSVSLHLLFSLCAVSAKIYPVLAVNRYTPDARCSQGRAECPPRVSWS